MRATIALTLIVFTGAMCAAQEAKPATPPPAGMGSKPLPDSAKVKILSLVAKSQSESNKALSAKVQAQEIADKASAAVGDINKQLEAAVETAKRENSCLSITEDLACVQAPKLPEKKEPSK